MLEKWKVSESGLAFHVAKSEKVPTSRVDHL
jgi:hypothetical protein